jgi:hypothetical protein
MYVRLTVPNSSRRRCTSADGTPVLEAQPEAWSRSTKRGGQYSVERQMSVSSTSSSVAQSAGGACSPDEFIRHALFGVSVNIHMKRD